MIFIDAFSVKEGLISAAWKQAQQACTFKKTRNVGNGMCEMGKREKSAELDSNRAKKKKKKKDAVL